MFCSKENMFGLKNIANILGAPPQEGVFAQPTLTASTSGKVASRNSESTLGKETSAVAVAVSVQKGAKENVKVLTKAPSPPFREQESVSKPSVVSVLPFPDDESEADAEQDVDTPFVDVDVDVKMEELRRELASSHQALKDVKEELATEKSETAKIQEELDAVQAKKDKVVNNLRNKKALFLQAQAQNVQLEKELACQLSNYKVATDETESLRAGLHSVSASREDLKQKLKSRQESLKQVRAEQDDFERKFAKVERLHATENKLLFFYRQLACHTGYFKWGKEIRVLESQLAEAAEEAAAAGNSSSSPSSSTSSNYRSSKEY
jgi:DNA repair exonuclease SbcCD ATPase subunit